MIRALLAALWLAGPALPVASAEEPAAGAPTPATFEAVRERLRVQVRGADDPVAPGAVARMDLPGTRTVLVLAAPDGEAVERDVTARDADAWGQGAEGLFDLAQEQLERAQPPRVRESPQILQGIVITLLYGDHPFASSYALAVRSYPRCMGRHGALMAVPNQHATLCYPIGSRQVRDALPAMATMAFQIQAEGVGAVTRNLYWVHDDGLDTLPVVVVNGAPRLTTTAAFQELVERLSRTRARPRWQDRRFGLP